MGQDREVCSETGHDRQRIGFNTHSTMMVILGQWDRTSKEIQEGQDRNAFSGTGQEKSCVGQESL